MAPGDGMQVEEEAGSEPDRRRLWWSRFLSRPIQYALDVVLLVGAFGLAYLLRFDFEVPEVWRGRAVAQVPVVLVVQFAALLFAGVYSFVWRYVGLSELRAFARAGAWAAAPLFLLRLGLPEELEDWRTPLSVIVIDTLLAFGGVLALRVGRRMLYERYERTAPLKDGARAQQKPVLLVGAGRAGVMAAREILGRGDMHLALKGFVDDDEAKQGSVIQGIKVLGTTRDIPRLARELAIDHVVITIARASRQQMRRVLDICEKAEVKVRIIPGLYEILLGQVSVSRVRDVQIEDLLGREPVKLDDDQLGRFLAGKAVMVTGAGGSIGSELARQVARFAPRSLLLVERAEGALFYGERELRASFPAVDIEPLIADVGDEARMRALFERHRPDVVLHAAAHKHVPMMEQNPVEAVKNNVLGTRAVARLAGEHGADAFVLISTDKAVRPTSVMGASKRMAELVVQQLQASYRRTRFVAVRFGNVLGSAGSVIPLFREQIANGGPVTVTHPDMVRYFMTIPEASQLVLQAGAMGEGGEIFVLDMGEPVRILDLARDMIRLSGLRPYEDIDITFSGVRPGEKLFEELSTTGEDIAKTRHPKIFIGKIAPQPPEVVQGALARAQVLVAADDGADIRALLGELLPEARLSPPPVAGPPEAAPPVAAPPEERAKVVPLVRATG